MYCTKCGNQMDDDQKYCGNCGSELESSSNNESTIIKSRNYAQSSTMNNDSSELNNLIHALEVSLPIYKKIDEYSQEENRIANNTIPTWGSVILGIAGFIIGLIILGPNNIYALAFAVLPPSIAKKYRKTKNDRKISAIKEESTQYIKNNYCEELLVLPDDYRYYIAAEYIYKCLVEGRADSLKEALNLFVEQKDRWVQQQMTQQITDMQRQQTAYLRTLVISDALKELA
ncbi:zinc-ribbon domain-containing protein [Butyrivibrio fibrisolvens DSM 3071]|uniref:Zinc-ribbon domain-containing protein n=1 Tax=Butyrivibrio fibrisolvens DSM 3071 TaxID=1121131 RepID=A0A1M5ZWQ2_BUTFI|nr:zinc ribbon domain-containing protein [Butyrivibrio fibrisolvens]SHI28660.1 zinc-ribbon domain-containing protein [Butyrivibrio fibrisolvens DSM 3071]